MSFALSLYFGTATANNCTCITTNEKPKIIKFFQNIRRVTYLLQYEERGSGVQVSYSKTSYKLFCGRSLSCLPPITVHQLEWKKKTSSKKIYIYLRFECSAKHPGLIEHCARKFHREPSGSKLLKRWLAQLSDLRTQLTVFVGEVFFFCKARQFFNTVFLKQ